MKRKHVLSLLALAVCASASSAAFAQQNIGVINFTGELTNSGCTYAMSGADVTYTVDGNNQGVGTVKLGSVEIAQLAAAGDVAGATPFTFTLTGCNVTAANNSMWVNFGDADPNVNSAGRVKTTGATANVAASLSLELLDDNSGAPGTSLVAGQPAGAGPTPTQGTTATFSGSNPSKNASKTYWVRYYTEAAGLVAADAGPITASVKYNVYHY